ncbi:hypothetical protein ACFL1R_12025 [Candidatus Latescibacterota bacterium]
MGYHSQGGGNRGSLLRKRLAKEVKLLPFLRDDGLTLPPKVGPDIMLGVVG